MKLKSKVLGSWPKYSLSYCVIIFYYGVCNKTNWALISNIKGESLFGDLYLVLKYSNCSDIYFNATDIGKCESSFIYGKSLLTILKFFPVNQSIVNILGYSLMILTLFCVIELIRIIQPHPSIKYEILTIILLTSPPLVLLFERGNLDSLIFILITISIYLNVKNHYIFSQLFVIFLNYIFLRGKIPKLINTMLLVLPCYFVISYLLTLNLDSIPNPTRAAFGSSLIGKFINQFIEQDLSRLWQVSIGLATSFLIYIVLSIYSRNSSLLKGYKQLFTTLSITEKYILYVFSIIYLSTFFISMNFDYRLIFIIPIYCLILSKQIMYKQLVAIISIISLWFSFQISILELVGDLFLLFFTFIYFYLFVNFITEPVKLYVKSKYDNLTYK